MKPLKTIGTLGILLAFSISAQADLLAPGGIVPLSVPSIVPQGGPGTLIASLTSPYSDGPVNGTLTSWVMEGSEANPFGGLSFYYQLNNTGPEPIGRVTVWNFGQIQADVGLLGDGGIAPASADRSVGGSSIGFSFPGEGQVPAERLSEIMVIHTSSQTWTEGLGAVIDHRSVNVAVLAPVPDVSSTLGLFGLAGAVLTAVRRKLS